MSKRAADLNNVAIWVADEVGYIVYPIRLIGGDEVIEADPIAAFHTIDALNDWLTSNLVRKEWES